LKTQDEVDMSGPGILLLHLLVLIF